MNYNTYHEIKRSYRMIRAFEKYSKAKGWDDTDIQYLKKDLRKLIKNECKKVKDLESCDKSIYYSESGETWTEYIKVEAFSRQDLAEELREFHRQHQVYSMYDCTGQHFVISTKFAHIRDNIYLVRIMWGIDV
jgi:hypothetical protein